MAEKLHERSGLLFRSIKTIRLIDAFDSFSWTAKPMERFNLVYGWNGSGKTTISRIFSFLEAGSIHLPDFSTIEFSIATDASVVKHENLAALPISVRVFNEDFVEDNLQFNNASAKTIVTVGKANKALLGEIDALEKNLETQSTVLSKIQKDKSKLPKLEQILKDAGNKVVKVFATTPLSTGVYDGRKYNASEVSRLVTDKILSPETIAGVIINDQNELEKQLDVISRTRSKVSLKISPLVDLSQVFQEVNEILGLDVQFEEIPELATDPALKSWVEQGVSLHEKAGAKSCYFCDGKLPPERIERYKKYFTDDLNTLKAMIASIRVKLSQSSREPLPKDGFQKTDLFPDQVTPFESLESDLHKYLTFLENSINCALDLLQKKDDGLHQHWLATECVISPKAAFAGAVECIAKIEEIITQQNVRCDDIEREINVAAKDIELSTVASHLIAADYFAKKKQCEDFDETFNLASNSVTTTKNAIATKKGSLQNVTDSIDKMNSIFEEFFGKDFIKFYPNSTTTEPVYVLRRRGKDCKRLSQGERSVIGLVYFLVKLDEDGFDKKKSCVVVDDPVDSQDGAFMFRAAALLKRYAHDVGQLLVLTHSFEYFNLTRDWLMSEDKKDDSALFMIQYQKDAAHEVRVSDLSTLLREYKSEYQYLFYKLYEYRLGRAPLDEPLVANIARKLLEYFAAFKWSCKTTEHFKTVINDSFVGQSSDIAKKITGEFVYKFVNEFSHGQDFTRQITSVALEAGEIAKKTLDFIRHADKEHYDSLKSECDRQIGGSSPSRTP